MRIALDAMGGDRAPFVPVEAGLMASKDLGVEIVLFGPGAMLRSLVDKWGPPRDRVRIEDAEEVIAMDEAPLKAIRQKQGSSMVMALRSLRDKKVDAVVGAGNSGAMVAGSLMTLGKADVALRPALMGILPGIAGPVGLIDVGANVDSRARHLMQYAILGSRFWKIFMKEDQPKVALLNIGVEEGKGSKAVKEAWAYLRGSQLNFVGFVEGHEVLTNRADVIVCDGFVGNVLLKALEGMGELIRGLVSSHVGGSNAREGTDWARSLSWEEYGGALLLGVNGTVVVCHGRSSTRAMVNAIAFARELREREAGYTKTNEGIRA